MSDTLSQELISEIMTATGYLDDFEIDAEETEQHNDEVFFDVSIKHKHLQDSSHAFIAKAKIDRDLNSVFFYINYSDGCWEMISQQSLYTFMWFNLAQRKCA